MAYVNSGKMANPGTAAQGIYLLVRDYICSRNGAGGDFSSAGLNFEYYDNNFVGKKCRYSRLLKEGELS